MVAEGRDLLLIGDDVEKARIYREYYSVERLRRLAERPSYRREGFQDLWQGLCVTFKLFDENWRGQVLGLSPLNGDLFGSNTLPDIDNCAIDNYDLVQAIKHLSLYVDKNGLRRVNYAALDVEELGSVYESLLDFHPQGEQCDFVSCPRSLPTQGRVLLAGEHTAWSRPDAVTLKERTIEHTSTAIAGNKPITIGQGYSTIAWIPEDSGSWALPLRHERITSWDNPIEKAVGQLKKVCEFMPSRPISVWDSEYGCVPFVLKNS